VGRTQPHHANVRIGFLKPFSSTPLPCSGDTTLPWGDIARRSRVDPPMQQNLVVEPCLSVITRHRRLSSQVRQSPSTHTPSLVSPVANSSPLCRHVTLSTHAPMGCWGAGWSIAVCAPARGVL
jgi:hypothetical protein